MSHSKSKKLKIFKYKRLDKIDENYKLKKGNFFNLRIVQQCPNNIYRSSNKNLQKFKSATMENFLFWEDIYKCKIKKGRQQNLTRVLADSGAMASICKLSHLTDFNIKSELIKCDSYNIQSSTSTIQNAVLGKIYLNVFLLNRCCKKAPLFSL